MNKKFCTQNIKIAAIVPIGHLDRHGYQHTYLVCLDSIVEFADKVFLVQSTPNQANVREVTLRYPPQRLELISQPITWFTDDCYQLDKVIDNMDLGLDLARAEGYQAVIALDVNGYVPRRAMPGLRRHCQKMVEDDQGYEWLYRADQLYGQMFHANVRKPWILNTVHPYRYSQESIICLDLKDRPESVRGDFREFDEIAVVDAQLELTLADLEAKYNYVRCYHELAPKRSPIFDWGYWRPYFLNKFRQKPRSDAKLDYYGERIRWLSQEDFVSRQILEELECPST